MSDNQPTLLITGASGQLGRRVVELLITAQAGNIIAATRTPEKLSDFEKQGVTIRQADFDDPDSLVTAFTGVDRLLLISTDAVGEPGRRIKQHINAVNAAEKAGVKHVIYTSLMNPVDSPVTLAPDHVATENALFASKLGWTILRNNIYADGQIASLQRAIQSGQLIKAAGDGKTAYVTREDCARIAAAVLADDFEENRILDVSGSEAVTQAQLAQLASQLSGKQVSYVPITVEAMVSGMESAGLPKIIAELVASFDDGIAQGKFEDVTNVIEDLTGQKPSSITDFITANREHLVTQTENQ